MCVISGIRFRKKNNFYQKFDPYCKLENCYSRNERTAGDPSRKDTEKGSPLKGSFCIIVELFVWSTGCLWFHFVSCAWASRMSRIMQNKWIMQASSTGVYSFFFWNICFRGKGGGGVNSIVIMTPFDRAASLRSIFKVILKMTFFTPSATRPSNS